MPEYVTTAKAAKLTGLHPNTLRKYADEGRIQTYKLPNGARRFDVAAYLGQSSVTVCYARVSQPKQKEDLERQKEYLLSHYPGAEVISDVGSGLNFKRKGLRSILERILRGEKLTIVVTYKDRLARFGFDLIEFLTTKTGGKIVVLNQINTSPMSELVGDITAIITVFSSRLRGLRSYKIKKHLVETNGETEETT